MELLLSFIFLAFGFLLLMKGADYFVDGSSKIAIKMHIPEIVIGLTIVAMGTSAPEAAISITAAFQNNAGISIGNVIGSNIMNIALILGISALIAKLPIKKKTLFIEIPFMIGITVVLILIGFFMKEINRIGALILIVLFLIFLTYLFWLSKNGDEREDSVEELQESDTYIKLITMTLLGVVAIIVGSRFTVSAATSIAQAFGLSERIIGLTIVAFGTSLPELVTSVSAARKQKTDIAIGNIVGSNIFNILFVLGVSGLVSPAAIPFSAEFLKDGVIAIIIAVLLFVFSYRKKELTKTGGLLFLVAYLIYLIPLFMK